RRGRSRRLRALAHVDAAPARLDAERLQRVADLRDDLVGAGERLRARVAELRAVRGAARAGDGALGGAGAAAARPPVAQGPLPARQPARVQPEVLPALGAAL